MYKQGQPAWSWLATLGVHTLGVYMWESTLGGWLWVVVVGKNYGVGGWLCYWASFRVRGVWDGGKPSQASLVGEWVDGCVDMWIGRIACMGLMSGVVGVWVGGRLHVSSAETCPAQPS